MKGTGELSAFVLSSPESDEPIDLPLGHITMGRSLSNEIVVPSRAVTRCHASLYVEQGTIELNDHGGANGTCLNGVNLGRSNAPLRVGDRISLGEFSFVLGLAEWVQPVPPGQLIVVPASGERVDRGWADHEAPQGWDDELWAAYYLRWRVAVVESLRGEDSDGPEHDLHWPVRAAGRMCSPPVLQWLRALLIEQDNRRWFLGCRDAFIRTLANAQHGIGPLLAFDIAMRHPEEAARRLAWSELEQLAHEDGHDDVATAIFERVPRDATSISALIAPVFGPAMESQHRWPVPRFLDYLSRPSFQEAASSVVFSVHSPAGGRRETFRPSDGDLLTLDDSATLDPRHTVRVARPEHLPPGTRRQWREHLVDFEIVQPLHQFDRH